MLAMHFPVCFVSFARGVSDGYFDSELAFGGLFVFSAELL